MDTRLEPGSVLDGFTVGECIHDGGMGYIYRVSGPQAGFPMIMKLPRIGSDGAGSIVGYEVEQQMLQAIASPHVPRFVAAGDLTRQPYLVMERIDGRTLDRWLEDAAQALAYAIVSASAVIDFDAAIIDGWMPQAIRGRLVEATRNAVEAIDVEGLQVPAIREGTVGIHARAIGGASLPLSERFLVGSGNINTGP